MMFSDKIIAPHLLDEKIKKLRSEKKTIATLNGSFDLLHAGHLYILNEAKKTADCLIVALNSDASIKAYKSPNRPIISLSYRLELLAALACVDYVTWFEETDPRMILSQIKPDVHVNGAEYGSNCIEAETIKQCGGKLHLVPRIGDGLLATSTIINKIKQLD